MSGGSGANAMKRRMPELRDLRQMDALDLQRVNSVALVEAASIRRRLVRIETGMIEADEENERRTRLALMHWEHVPELVRSVFSERQHEADPLRRHLVGLYRAVLLMVEVDKADSPDETTYDMAYNRVLVSLDIINDHLTTTGALSGSEEG